MISLAACDGEMDHMLASQKQFQLQLEQISQKLQRGNAQSAIHDIQSLPAKLQQHPNIQHLHALTLKSLGQVQMALTIMRTLVKRYPKQVEFHNNLANLLKEVGEEQSATYHYEHALSLNPSYLDAFKNLLILHIDNADLARAKAMLDHSRSTFAKSVVYQKFEADYFLAIKEHALAQEKYQQVLLEQPNYSEAKIGLAKVFIQQNKYIEAVKLLQEIVASGPSALAQYQLAIAYFELSEYTKSEYAFKQAITINPAFVAAHVQLNEMLWQLGDTQQFGKSFLSVLGEKPQLSHLRVAYVDLLINAEHYEQAMQHVLTGLQIQPKQHSLLYFKALIMANNDKLEEAFTIMQDIWQTTLSFKSGIELIKLSIKLTKYDIALQVVNELQRDFAQNQLVLAYKATCLKLMDRVAYEEFIQLGTSIRAFELPTPEGYNSLPDFLHEVKEVLVSMHQTNSRPLQQTLRKGTQTPGRLLDREHPVLLQLKWAYETTINNYIEHLPNDPKHEFFKRKLTGFKITGSWSVKLEDKGFHVNHVHPEGWISSACYISLPDNLSSDEGCIRFGQSPLELGSVDEPDLIITPKEGLLVLFPSFMWHGTQPFHSNKMRLTAPFDVVPVDVLLNDEGGTRVGK